MPTLPPALDRLNHTVAFRLTDGEYLELLPFFEACEGRPSTALRWLLSQPESQELMRAAVKEANAKRRPSPTRNGKAQPPKRQRQPAR